MGYREYSLCFIVLCNTDHRHAITADIDNNPTDFLQQLRFIHDVNQRMICVTEYTQRAVYPDKFLLRLLAIGDVMCVGNEKLPAIYLNPTGREKHLSGFAIFCPEC